MATATSQLTFSLYAVFESVFTTKAVVVRVVVQNTESTTRKTGIEFQTGRFRFCPSLEETAPGVDFFHF